MEALKQSLALSSTYKTLCERIKSAENANALNLLTKDVNLELDIYTQRSKQLKKLMSQRKELIGAMSENLEGLIESVAKDDYETKPISEPDF